MFSAALDLFIGLFMTICVAADSIQHTMAHNMTGGALLLELAGAAFAVMCFARGLHDLVTEIRKK